MPSEASSMSLFVRQTSRVRADNKLLVCLTLLSIPAWDVVWQLRGLSLPSGGGAQSSWTAWRRHQLVVEPRRGLVVSNGRAGHLQAREWTWRTARSFDCRVPGSLDAVAPLVFTEGFIGGLRFQVVNGPT